MRPRAHVTVVVPEHVPCDAVADTNVIVAGSASTSVVFEEYVGPWSRTMKV
jgi:hypothetical protein